MTAQNESAGVRFFVGKPGVLRLRGRDVLDFLHRMSTNDVSRLKEGECATTLLTTEKGRMIDLVRVVVRDGVLLLASEGSTDTVHRWLEKFVIMEDVHISDATDRYSALNIFGDPAGHIASSIAPRFVSCKDERWHNDVYTILVPDSDLDDTVRAVTTQNAAQELSREELNRMMIENGIPIRGVEITDEYNPLELNLEHFVSFTKGCYIGQEIIARLDSYQKVQKRLTGFYLDSDATTGQGAGTIYAGEEEVGKTTRHAVSGSGRRHIALGFLRTGVDAGSLSFASDGGEERTGIHPVPLPMVTP